MTGVLAVDPGKTTRRVALWTETGRFDAKTSTPRPAQVKDAVSRILADDHNRGEAHRIQADFSTHNGPHEASVLIETVAKTGQPVLRADILMGAARHRTDRIYTYPEHAPSPPPAASAPS